MARTPYDGNLGHSDSATDTKTTTIAADASGKLLLPDSAFVADAQMTRDGQDLVLEAPDGSLVVVEGYFIAEPAPVLHAPNGAALTPDLVDSFVRSPSEFAQNATATDESPVGAVEEVSGNAFVIRADGTKEPITIGTPIYEGDIIETDASGAVNIVFIDETSFAISENARMAVDQYVFDPSTESGSTNFSVLRGVFVFTSGLIGRDDPDDVEIDTPVGSIGIRGTIIAGNINPDGESEITVIEGAIVVKNGFEEKTLSLQFETLKLDGFDSGMESVGVLDAQQVSTRFSSISGVSPTLFSAINDVAKEQAGDNSQPQDAQGQEAAPDAQPEPQETAPQQDGNADPVTGDTLMQTGMEKGFGNTEQPATSTTATATASSAEAATQTASQNTAPPPPPPSQNLPPQTTAATTPQTLPPLVIDMQGGAVAENAADGQLIGTVSTTLPYSGVQFSFLNGSTVSANGYFRLETVDQDTARVVLTTSGQAALNDHTPLGDFGIRAVLADGRSVTKNFPVNIFDPTPSLNLNAPATGDHVTKIGENLGNKIGNSVSALGDINNDGFVDFIFSNNSTAAAQNHTYIVYGKAGYIPSGSISALAGANHIAVTSTPNPLNGIYADSVVSGIGDFDGDGVEDYIVGQSMNDGNNSTPNNTGNAFIVSGDGGGVIGFNMGLNPGDQVGSSVSGIGDINNDGFMDVLIGAPGRDGGGTNSGGAYIIYGNPSWPATLNGSSISPSQGFYIGGAAAENHYGEAVSFAGDFNGDGRNDLAISAPGADPSGQTDAGVVKVYHGQATGTPPSPELQIMGTAGQKLGSDLSYAGDFDGDGLSDLFITAEDINSVSGQKEAYLIFGGNSGTVNVDTMSLAQGIKFYLPEGSSADFAGGAGVGDFNGDGYDDFALAIRDGSKASIYVVYGSDTPSNMGWSDLENSSKAFEMEYSNIPAGEFGFNIAAVGDINGDGFDDLSIGLPDAQDDNGQLLLVYGRDAQNQDAIRGNNISAANHGNILVGTSAADIIRDGSKMDVTMRGGAGNDIFEINNANFNKIDGGTGMDTLKLMAPGSSVNFASFNFEDMSGIEVITFGANSQTIQLSFENIFNLLKASDNGTLKFDKIGTGATLIIDDPSHSSAPAPIPLGELATDLGGVSGVEGGYNEISIGGYTLYIDQTIAVQTQ